eukprot:scaffold17628_cov77-Cyclotella_meneghiniana.AAC.3
MASAVVLTDTEPGATISASNAAARSRGIREGVGGVWEGLGYYLEAAGHGRGGGMWNVSMGSAKNGEKEPQESGGAKKLKRVRISTFSQKSKLTNFLTFLLVQLI